MLTFRLPHCVQRNRRCFGTSTNIIFPEPQLLERLMVTVGAEAMEGECAVGIFLARKSLRCCYSGTVSPDPPNSFGKSFSLVIPSRIGSTVSA
jgi:hypothetical protein